MAVNTIMLIVPIFSGHFVARPLMNGARRMHGHGVVKVTSDA